jgi:hypothetical protein
VWISFYHSPDLRNQRCVTSIFSTNAQLNLNRCQTHREEVEVRERVLGKEHPSTLTSMNNLALALVDQGQYKEAEKFQAVVIVGILRIFGSDHPDSKTCMNTMLTIWNTKAWRNVPWKKRFLNSLMER